MDGRQVGRYTVSTSLWAIWLDPESIAYRSCCSLRVPQSTLFKGKLSRSWEISLLSTASTAARGTQATRSPMKRCGSRAQGRTAAQHSSAEQFVVWASMVQEVSQRYKKNVGSSCRKQIPTASSYIPTTSGAFAGATVVPLGCSSSWVICHGFSAGRFVGR